MSGLFSGMFSTKSGVINLDSESFENQLKEDKDAVLIDTRTRGEFDDGHIPNSLLIDMMSPTFRDEIVKLDKSKSYFLYCRSGNRSYHAGRMMTNMGFDKVYNLKDGII